MVYESIVCTAPEQSTSNSVTGDLVHCYKHVNIWKHTLLSSLKNITLFACIFPLLKSMPNNYHAHIFWDQKQWLWFTVWNFFHLSFLQNSWSMILAENHKLIWKNCLLKLLLQIKSCVLFVVLSSQTSVANFLCL